MKVLHRYFVREIVQAVLFVLLAFLSLFAFLELNSESQSIGKGLYRIEHAFLYVMSGLPAYVYETMPIAALIGTIYALSQLAARSEFTIMRASSMSTWMAGSILLRIGIIFAVITFVFGEFIAPAATQWGQQMRLRMLGTGISNEFRSGLWTKDNVRDSSGIVIGTRFLNVRKPRPDGQLLDVSLYEFDHQLRLQSLVTAKKATYVGEHVWRLTDVSEARFEAGKDGKQWSKLGLQAQDMRLVENMKLAQKDVVSEMTPKLMSVLFAADPDRMSAYDLALYSSHLEENKQNSQRYEIAFWKKVTYPLAVFVMMALALPFAYLQTRGGGVSLKIFLGIMIGVGFHLLNSLFSTLGLLNTWPALFTAIAPSSLFLMLSLLALWWVERR